MLGTHFILLDIFTVTLQLRLVQRKLLSLFNLNSLNLKLSIITHFFYYDSFHMVIFTFIIRIIKSKKSKKKENKEMIIL